MKKETYLQKNAQTKSASSAWWGKSDINSSVIKSKKRKIKISNIYTCDKRRRVKVGRKTWLLSLRKEKISHVGVFSLGAALVSHFFIAAGSLTALSVTAEMTRQTGCTLCSRESRRWPAAARGAREQLGGNWGTRIKTQNSPLIWNPCECAEWGGLKNKDVYSYKQQLEEWYNSIKYTILQTFKWSALLTKNLCCLTALIAKTLVVQTAGWDVVRHKHAHACVFWYEGGLWYYVLRPMTHC